LVLNSEYCQFQNKRSSKSHASLHATSYHPTHPTTINKPSSSEFWSFLGQTVRSPWSSLIPWFLHPHRLSLTQPLQEEEAEQVEGFNLLRQWAEQQGLRVREVQTSGVGFG
jgi:hypothetical protein